MPPALEWTFGSGPDTGRNHLARRLMARRPGHHKMGLLNEGIGGNRVLADVIGPNALARLDRDVLMQTGVRQVIVLEGLNDITFGALGFPARPADESIAGHRQLIERAHAHGLSIVGGTLTPIEGSTVIPGSFTPESEAKR